MPEKACELWGLSLSTLLRIGQRRSLTAGVALFLVVIVSAVATRSGFVAAQSGPCEPPNSNPIVCENQKAGAPASEWDISDAGDPSIQGFATDISVNRGERVWFKVNTPASSYQLHIYRLGYYSGFGARKIATVTPSAPLPQTQPSCLSEAATGLVDCGNWAVSASWVVPSDAVSGIYIARLQRGDTGGASHVVFVVRDDGRSSDVLFQTADTTWQAYNTYGGNSLYAGEPVGRAYKVSYNRPFTTRQFTPESFLFNAEYAMLRWLEGNGYDVSYTTGVDADRRGSSILNHKSFISVGHDEYWSGQQRANVEAARDAGVHLAFFSGNEVFWKTRWESSFDASAVPYRTLVCYKETAANAKIDPLPNVWTGTWRDPRFSPPSDGGRPENSLTGTIFTVNGYRNDPMTVSAAEGRLRFWRHTTVAALQPGQVATFANGILGYEWDEDLDNGARPPGLIRLSTTTLDVSPKKLLDYGSTYGSGTATHSLTLYRHSSGALVFGAGTVQWSWGLDFEHDLWGFEPDSRIQQATVNLLADMGVQPLTLQSGLVSTPGTVDFLAPVSSIFSPSDGAAFSVGNPVVISGTATDSSGGVVAGVEVSVDNGTTWQRASGRENWAFTWTPTQQGIFTIRSRAVDDSANIESPGDSITVLDPDLTAPNTSNVQATLVTDTTGRISWLTNEPADTQVEYGLTTSYGTMSPLNAARTLGHAVPLTGLTPGSLYHYRVRSRDQSGNLAVSADFTFMTPAPGTCPCSLWSLGTVPATASHTETNAVEMGVRFTTQSDGQISGLRFYKGPANTGVHTGNLWTETGILLASATFTNETASGWQEVTFSPPVGVTPGVVYVASYHAPNGGYALNANYFSAPYDNAPLHAPGGGNGVYRYGATGFPTSTFAGSNYWVDVVFTPGDDIWPPVIGGVQAAQVTAGSAIIQWNTNEPADSQVEYGTTAAYGNTTALDTTRVLAHSIDIDVLAPDTLYHYRVRSRDKAGHLTVSGDFTLRTAPPESTPPTISTVQATLVTDTSARISWLTNEPADTQVEYGLTTSYGAVTPLDQTRRTGHVVSLAGLTPGTVYHYRVASRDPSGNLTQSPDSTFTTSAPGSCPCSLWSLGTVPVVASQTEKKAVELGVRFSADTDGLISGLRFYKGPTNTGLHVGNLWTDSGILLATATFTNESASGWQEVAFSPSVGVVPGMTYVASYHAPNGGYAVSPNYFTGQYDNAPLHAAGPGNGVYRYGASGFPASTFGGTNYWVDVVFTPGPDVTPPAISGVHAAQLTAATATIRWTTNERADSQVEYGTTTAYGNLTPLDTAQVLAHSSDLVGLTPNTLYHYRVRSSDAAGHFSVSADLTFRTTPPDITPPLLTALQATLVTDTAARISWLTNEPADTQVEYGLTTSYGAVTPLDVARTLEHAAQLGGLTPGTVYHYRARSRDSSGNLRLSPDFTFTTSAPGVCPCSLWNLSTLPAIASQGDSAAVEIGVRFSADSDGQISGLRFYKGPANTGAHVGNLWTDTGVLLATAGFTNETASGWQEVRFATPVAVTPGVRYVASYYAPNGGYAVDPKYFAAPYDNAPLHAPTGNGVYRYGASGFPTSASGSNYWVDVVFTAAGDSAPAITAVQATLVTETAARISWITNEPADTQVEYGPTTAYGAVTTLDPAPATGHGVSLSGLTPGTAYHYRARSRDAAGNLTLSPDFTFTTPAPGVCPCSLWSLGTVPATASQGDAGALEVGVRFSTESDGQITGLRFFKGAANTGVHVGNLWTDTGVLLATATFINETASGWQEVRFATPVAVTPGVTYVASYHAPNGGYALNVNYFAVPYDNAPLHAPTGNGVYRYGPSGFPTSPSGSNYWVDVVFATGNQPPPPVVIPTLSIADVSVTEGNSGSVLAGFFVSLSEATTQTVTVAYATSNGTAVAGSDYTAASGTLTFPPGVTQQTINVALTGDVRNEFDETLVVTLTAPVNATRADAQAIGTVVDDDPLPIVNVGNVTVTEGNSGTLAANFAVTLSAASGRTVRVSYATADGTAAAGADYTSTSGTLTFAPGITSQTVLVSVTGDVLDEGNDTFTLALSSPENASLGVAVGTGTINDNDATPSLRVNDLSLTEGDSGTQTAVFTVTLSAVSGRAVTVNYATSNGTASAAGGDYVATSGSLSFPVGVTAQTVTVVVNSDVRDEADETLNLNLSTAVNATIADSRGVATIVDNDPTPTVSIADVTITEGNSGAQNVTFTLTLSAASNRTITVVYTTADGTALAGSDYTARTATVTFNAGVVTRTFTVSVTGDTLLEPNEAFVVNLTSPTNVIIADAQAVCTIVNND